MSDKWVFEVINRYNINNDCAIYFRKLTIIKKAYLLTAWLTLQSFKTYLPTNWLLNIVIIGLLIILRMRFQKLF